MLELVVVVGILAFVIGPLVLSSRSSIGKAEYDMKRALAVNLATRMAERFGALDYRQAKATLGGEGFDPEKDPLLAPETYPDFLKERLVEYRKSIRFEEFVPDRLGMIQVEIRWIPKQGAPETSLKASKVVVNPYPARTGA